MLPGPPIFRRALRNIGVYLCPALDQLTELARYQKEREMA